MLIIVSILCIVKDFFILKPKRVTNTTIPDDSIKVGISLCETAPNKAMRDSIKSDSQSVFNLSNMLEEQWGVNPLMKKLWTL